MVGSFFLGAMSPKSEFEPMLENLGVNFQVQTWKSQPNLEHLSAARLLKIWSVSPKGEKGTFDQF